MLLNEVAGRTFSAAYFELLSVVNDHQLITIGHSSIVTFADNKSFFHYTLRKIVILVAVDDP